jgi:hypothetical protein
METTLDTLNVQLAVAKANVKAAKANAKREKLTAQLKAVTAKYDLLGVKKQNILNKLAALEPAVKTATV